MKKAVTTIFTFFILTMTIAQSSQQKVMNGFPPTRESQVTYENYRTYPFSQWAFRNIGAPLHMLMMPRAGAPHAFKEVPDKSIAEFTCVDVEGKSSTFENIFRDNHADGVVVIRSNAVLYENYWNGLSRDYQHIWFSVTKSLTSSAIGILVDEKKIDLSASPAQYIPELKGSAYERTTIQDLLNMSTALGFEENYVDSTSFFWKHYAMAMNFFYSPGQVPGPKTSEVYGTYDFLAKKATINKDLQPGQKFEYNSSNADVLGWLISKVSGKPYRDFIRENIWMRIGAEHDASLAVDRAYMGVATAGMSTTLRDAALFGNLILNRGSLDGKQIIPQAWVDETLRLTMADKKRYNPNNINVKTGTPWVAYKNFWWILDETNGEYCALGIHGQAIYINRSADMVIAFFSSQPQASDDRFVSKLNACRSLAKMAGR